MDRNEFRFGRRGLDAPSSDRVAYDRPLSFVYGDLHNTAEQRHEFPGFIHRSQVSASTPYFLLQWTNLICSTMRDFNFSGIVFSVPAQTVKTTLSFVGPPLLIGEDGYVEIKFALTLQGNLTRVRCEPQGQLQVCILSMEDHAVKLRFFRQAYFDNSTSTFTLYRSSQLRKDSEVGNNSLLTYLLAGASLRPISVWFDRLTKELTIRTPAWRTYWEYDPDFALLIGHNANDGDSKSSGSGSSGGGSSSLVPILGAVAAGVAILVVIVVIVGAAVTYWWIYKRRVATAEAIFFDEEDSDNVRAAASGSINSTRGTDPVGYMLYEKMQMQENPLLDLRPSPKGSAIAF
jgi:hypothetical protein